MIARLVDSLKSTGQRFVRWMTELVHKLGAGMVVTALIIAVLGFTNQHSGVFIPEPLITDFYANVATELASIAITVLIINRLYQQRETEREKARLIREMGSNDNGIALRAVRELEAQGWLSDGSLKGAFLRGANLEGAHLGRANLEGAHLVGANFSHANLYGANLSNVAMEYANLERTNLHHASFEGATLLGANLKSANFNETNLCNACLGYADLSEARVSSSTLSKVSELYGATLPDGHLYPGFYDLPLDIAHAQELGVDIDDPAAMTKFYGISLQEYKRGYQKWFKRTHQDNFQEVNQISQKQRGVKNQPAKKTIQALPESRVKIKEWAVWLQ